MVLWRISRHLNLSGMGGFRAGGRWHDRGHPVVYLSENPASALLEVCVHTAANDVPPEYTLLRIEGPDLTVDAIDPQNLPIHWQTQADITRKMGTFWLRSNQAVLIRVPSAVVPHTTNFLFNPLHIEAKLFRIMDATSYPLDPRLKV